MQDRRAGRQLHHPRQLLRWTLFVSLFLRMFFRTRLRALGCSAQFRRSHKLSGARLSSVDHINSRELGSALLLSLWALKLTSRLVWWVGTSRVTCNSSLKANHAQKPKVRSVNSVFLPFSLHTPTHENWNAPIDQGANNSSEICGSFSSLSVTVYRLC